MTYSSRSEGSAVNVGAMGQGGMIAGWEGLHFCNLDFFRWNLTLMFLNVELCGPHLHAENDLGDREIDDQTRRIDQRRDEWR